jgi:hypothetical protein
MSRLKSSPRSVEVFSALKFFSQCAAGIARPTGQHEGYLKIPDQGLHVVNQSSLEWIDGFFAQNQMCELFVSSVERRELPPPLISQTAQYVDSHCEYTSTELLANCPKSLLAAFNLVEHLAETALLSPTVNCPSCKCTSSRIISPLMLGNRLLHDFATREVSLLASSTDEKFKLWSAAMGLTVQYDDNDAQAYVCLDSGVCSEDFIARLSRIFRSIWSIPQIIFTCRSAAATEVYAPQGWCIACKQVLTEPDRAELTKFLSRGHLPEQSPTKAFSLERTLSLDSRIRIEDLATRPFEVLQDSRDPRLQDLAVLLQAFDMGRHPPLTPCNALSPEEIALLSITVSLYKSRGMPSTIIADLPSGILSRVQARLEAARELSQFSHHSVILLGEPLVEHEKSIVDTPVKAGVSLEQKSSQVADISSSASSNTSVDMSSLTEVPLFPSRTSTTRTLGDELGVIPGVAQLYAASIDARCIGLVAKDFTFGALRSHPYLCRGCKGLGVILVEHSQLPRPLAKPCSVCLGAHFKEPVASTLFRGIPYSSFLNLPVEQVFELLRSLQRSKYLPQYITLLDLQHLPLGMPTALLSTSELRRVLILKGLLVARGNTTRAIRIEAPHLGFTKVQRDGLEALQKLPELAGTCRWLRS